MAVYLITGGTNGIGAETARLAVAAGNDVFVTGRDEGRLRSLVQELGEEHAAGSVADAGDWGETEAAVASALARFGRLDVVFANAGFGISGDLSTLDPDETRSMVLTNVLGPMLLARAALPSLKESRGFFLVTGSVAGRKAMPGSAYSSTKWAVHGFAESLRQLVVGTGIRTAVIAPGRVDTPFWEKGVQGASLSATDIARAVLWITSQPDHVDVNEILVRPVGQQG